MVDIGLSVDPLVWLGGRGGSLTEDPAELPLFERALELYRALGDPRGKAEALFWIGCLHQFIRRDNETAVPHLERSLRLAVEAGDKSAQSAFAPLDEAEAVARDAPAVARHIEHARAAI